MAIDSLESNMSEFLVLATKKYFQMLLNTLVIFSVPRSNFFSKAIQYFPFILFSGLEKEILWLPNFKHKYLYLCFTF